MDHKVNKVLVDTETLLDQYRKKITDIGKNLETTKRYREEVNQKVGGFERQLGRVGDNCDQNHQKFSQHVDHISLKFAETTVDLNSANEGFQREIERANILFKEL
jgi:ribosome-associated translation inhibitor RaiA